MKLMTRLLMVLFLVASLSLFAACDSDDSDGGGGDGDGPAADTTGEGDGAATDAAEDAAEETAAETTPEGGKCENEADLAILEASDANNTSKECAVGPCGGDVDCLADCIINGNEAKEIDGIGLSEGCAACFAGSTACGFASCLADCIADATSEGCLTCMAEHCTQAFCDCAGASLSETCE